uniref:Vacuole membrane protein 1 n=1 Tax=Chromera velia CCMP2878 TaxID=1169474 RepID=A0A0G4I722_9ALVE|eukprot:Cvel_11483.t1-p1 / transcript=Cvel_11483.t1 / gene=Cvel_11483 / organism=Chromera_velia_CCMP2878 / gene_product=Vacuole membrane protein 1, putative / transcript_product=Vacuole membrane protein 1, putative / location=Cvel_scaffold723:46394-54997(-) / protein_length=581 / sequence_SO=supercontig / SO=protein_coding / is_pseudo=false
MTKIHYEDFPPEVAERLRLRSASLRESRKSITLLSHPVKTLSSFFFIAARAFKRALVYLISHPLTLFLVVPLFAFALVAQHFEGPHRALIDEARINLEFVAWWLVLGILSSVGLGSGMHSGLLFMFPHIYFVATTAEECGSLDFDMRKNMWNDVMEPGMRFPCDPSASGSSIRQHVVTLPAHGGDPLDGVSSAGGSAASALLDTDAPSFLSIFLKVWPATLLWGAGTALGELPPYAASFAAAKAREADEDFEEIQRELQSNDLMARMKRWMVTFLESHGWWGVVAMSAWPNVMFDVCGICCGHFQMPLSVFFSALLLGKAVLKTGGQTMFFLFLFMRRYDHWKLHVISMLAAHLPFVHIDEKALEAQLEATVERLRTGGLSDSKSGEESEGGSGAEDASWIQSLVGNLSFDKLFRWILAVLIAVFFLSCVDQFAQMRQKEVDEATLEAEADAERQNCGLGPRERETAGHRGATGRGRGEREKGVGGRGGGESVSASPRKGRGGERDEKTFASSSASASSSSSGEKGKAAGAGGTLMPPNWKSSADGGPRKRVTDGTGAPAESPSPTRRSPRLSPSNGDGGT